MKRLLLVTIAAIGIGPTSAIAGVIYAGPGANNVDTDPATMVDLFIGDSGTIADINIGVNITGFHMEDFDVSISHNGTTVVLIDPDVTGFSHRDLFDVIFDDESANVVMNGGDLIGDYQPLDLLSAFDGMDLSGTWTLSILDTFVPGEGDTLVSWYVDATVVTEPGTLALLGLGLFGIGMARRRKKV